MSKYVLLSLVLLGGCNGGAGFLDGAGFEVGDAVFERKTSGAPVTIILVSDVGDLCERISSGRSLAGHSELAIKSFESGSVNAALRTYADDCTIETTELASQGWVDDQSDGPYQADFDVIFQTESRSVSGRLTADFCTLPENARIGCE